MSDKLKEVPEKANGSSSTLVFQLNGNEVVSMESVTGVSKLHPSQDAMALYFKKWFRF